MVIVVTSFLHGRTSEKISQLLTDLQPLECHVFCSQSEEMHSELIPMPGEIEGGGVEGVATTGYSHYGEFQALLRKWTNREVSVSGPLGIQVLGRNVHAENGVYKRLSIL